MNRIHRKIRTESPCGWTAISLGVWLGIGLLLAAGPARADTPETTEELLAKAAWEVRVFNFEKGHDLFVEAMEQSEEGSADWQQAVFGAAITIQLMAPPDADKLAKAEELYGLLMQKTPKSKYVPRAMMMMGRIRELRDFTDDKFRLEEARIWYQRVVDNYPEDQIAGEATFRVAATYVQTYDEEQAKKGIQILKDWLKEHPDDPMASGMWQYLGDTYFCPLNDYRNSLDCYIQADEIGLLERGREGPVYWRMAVMADRIKDRENAVKYYTKIIQLVPTSGKAYESQLALKRLGAPVPQLDMFVEMLGGPVPGETIPTADEMAAPPAKSAPAQSSETEDPQAKEVQK